MSNGALVPQINGSKARSHWLSKAREHLAQELSTAWGDGMLILNCFVTGLLDSAVFSVWSCFVSMQTGISPFAGNTIYLGLGATHQPSSQPWRWAKSGTAILSFLLGCYVSSRLMRHAGALQRSSIVGATLVQALLISASALLTTVGAVPRSAGGTLPSDFIVLLPLALLSAQAGAQIFVSRVLGCAEVTSVVLTSAYCDLVVDEKLFVPATVAGNVKRNRRAASMVALLLGAIVGGALTREGDISAALWSAGAIKLVFAGVWMGWKRDGVVRLE
ncbi:MAG: hypothetical protein LQ340_000835 [Diploschistes diacapsis]|nr:MAG: hypothetical protein LQ340_000835 [Diploschistes diacapsis]